MIIRAVYIGNSEEAYINKEFKEGLNIISSDDNNKGKTIVIQAIMYCLGNIPAFPSAFDYENYYFILYIEQDDKLIKICRKNKNFVIRKDEEYTVFDNTAEFKRYWNKNIQKLPIIKKENIYKIVDPELLVQIFFVGQDKKVTYDIVNKGFYKKEDFYKLIYSMAGINGDAAPMEGFWGIMKREMYYGKKYKIKDELIKAIEKYIDYYTNRRVQRNLCILTPQEYYEKQLSEAA